MTAKFQFCSNRFQILKFQTWQCQKLKKSISQFPSLAHFARASVMVKKLENMDNQAYDTQYHQVQRPSSKNINSRQNAAKCRHFVQFPLSSGKLECLKINRSLSLLCNTCRQGRSLPSEAPEALPADISNQGEIGKL
jgi:hypothetical protein